MAKGPPLKQVLLGGFPKPRAICLWMLIFLNNYGSTAAIISLSKNTLSSQFMKKLCFMEVGPPGLQWRTLTDVADNFLIFNFWHHCLRQEPTIPTLWPSKPWEGWWLWTNYHGICELPTGSACRNGGAPQARWTARMEGGCRRLSWGLGEETSARSQLTTFWIV